MVTYGKALFSVRGGFGNLSRHLIEESDKVAYMITKARLKFYSGYLSYSPETFDHMLVIN
jgi:hypothetical protein